MWTFVLLVRYPADLEGFRKSGLSGVWNSVVFLPPS